jgi:hypothetical protein
MPYIKKRETEPGQHRMVLAPPPGSREMTGSHRVLEKKGIRRREMERKVRMGSLRKNVEQQQSYQDRRNILTRRTCG